MSSAKLQSIYTIVVRELQARKGSMKVTAALGELLAADMMVNLCSAAGVWNEEPYSDADRQVIDEVDQRVHVQVNEAWAAFEAAEDRVAASAQFVTVILSATKALRELVKGIDFYDDTVVDPYPRIM